MRKLFLLVAIVIFWISACASIQPVSLTETPAAASFDASLATPAAGFVTVRKFENLQALNLRSLPDQQSALVGQVVPGEQGKVLGFNANGTWALLKFAEQSGWAPVVALDLTIAE